jgi:hypothetical protein
MSSFHILISLKQCMMGCLRIFVSARFNYKLWRRITILVMDMEYSRQGNRTNSNMYGAAGPVGASPGADQEDHNAQFKAQIGYAESVQRQLMRGQAKIIGLENELKELKN